MCFTRSALLLSTVLLLCSATQSQTVPIPTPSPAVPAQAATAPETKPDAKAATTSEAKAETTPAPAPAADAAKEYTIRLHRPKKVGQVVDCTVTGSVKWKTTYSVEGEVTGERESQFEYIASGTVETKAVDDKGRDTKVSITIRRLTRTSEDTEVELIAPGKVILADRVDRNMVYTYADTAMSIPQEASNALEAARFGTTYGGPTADNIYLTDRPRRIGDSWSINNELLAKTFSDRSDLTVTKEDVVGQMQLVGLVKEDEVDCLKLRSDHTVTKIPLSRTMPEGSKLLDCKDVTSTVSLVPVDVTLQRITGRSSRNVRTVIQMPSKDPGKSTTVTTVYENEMRYRATPQSSATK